MKNVNDLKIGTVYRVLDKSVSVKAKNRHRRVSFLKFIKETNSLLIFKDKLGLERSFMKRQLGISLFIKEI